MRSCSCFFKLYFHWDEYISLKRNSKKEKKRESKEQVQRTLSHTSCPTPGQMEADRFNSTKASYEVS